MHLEDSSRYYRCTLAVLVLSSLHYQLWSHSCCNRILDNDRIRRVTVITVTYYIICSNFALSFRTARAVFSASLLLSIPRAPYYQWRCLRKGFLVPIVLLLLG